MRRSAHGGGNRRLAAACIGWAMLLAVHGHAMTLDERGVFTVNAFGTLGAVYNSDSDVQFQRDFFQPGGPEGEVSVEPDSVLGAQLSIRPAPKWEVMLQLVSRHDSTADGYTPRFTWAFVKYAPDPAFSLRLGRVGYDAFMRADSRNVGYSYLTVRPPIEYYGSLAPTHIDGADVEYTTPLAGGLLSVKLFGGLLDEEAVRGGGRFDNSGSEVVGGYLDYRRGNWQVRAGTSQAELDRESPALAPLLSQLRGTGIPGFVALADDLALEDARIVNSNLGVVYDRGPLQVQLFYNRRQSESITLSDGDAYYTLAGYRVARVTPYLGYVQANGESSPSSFSPLPPAQAEALATASLLEQHTWLAGLRYDFMRNVDLKLQVERVDAPEPQGALFEAEPGWDGDTTVVSITLDFFY